MPRWCVWRPEQVPGKATAVRYRCADCGKMKRRRPPAGKMRRCPAWTGVEVGRA